MNVSPAIFRAYDIRGIVDTTLTPEVVEQIGLAFGSEAAVQGQDTVVIARDGRLSSPDLAESLAAGLQAAGRDVIDIGLAPTPVLYFATYWLETGTGIMITGSHNPPDYNGFKMMIDGATLHDESIQDLRKRIETGDFVSGEGGYTRKNIIPEYVNRIANEIQIDRPLNFVVDAGNGAAGEVAVELFKALNQKPVELYCDIDGHFPNHHPDPSKEKNLQDVRKAVAEQGLELGLAFDGDGDRLGVVDGNGYIIWPDRQMILYARDILERNPGSTIIFDVKCSKHLKDAIEQAGGKAVMSKTGHSFIKTTMIETGALLGGEMSGHIFFKERWYGFDDALYTAARLLEILSRDERSPEEVFAALPNSVNTPELNVTFSEGEHFKFIEAFQAQAQFEGANVIDIDGVRADFDDGWGLVRASNTSPMLVLRFEADTEAALERIQEQFREQMLRVKPDIELPF